MNNIDLILEVIMECEVLRDLPLHKVKTKVLKPNMYLRLKPSKDSINAFPCRIKKVAHIDGKETKTKVEGVLVTNTKYGNLDFFLKKRKFYIDMGVVHVGICNIIEAKIIKE